MLAALKNYSKVAADKSKIDRMQVNFKCCGSRDFTDWWNVQWNTAWIDPYELSVSILLNMCRLFLIQRHILKALFVPVYCSVRCTATNFGGGRLGGYHALFFFQAFCFSIDDIPQLRFLRIK